MVDEAPVVELERDGGVVLTNDSDEEAIAEFRRLQSSPTTTVTPGREEHFLNGR